MTNRRTPVALNPANSQDKNASLQSADISQARQELADLIGRLLAEYWLERSSGDRSGVRRPADIEVGSREDRTES